MLFKLVVTGDPETTFLPYMERSASELGLNEKDLENWMAENPDLLFGAEHVLVISQSVAGRPMADILALDADGQLVIVEIKRDCLIERRLGSCSSMQLRWPERTTRTLSNCTKTIGKDAMGKPRTSPCSTDSKPWSTTQRLPKRTSKVIGSVSWPLALTKAC